jgi:hypothetical protein
MHYYNRFIFFEDVTSKTSITNAVFAFNKFQTMSNVALVKMLKNGKLAFYTFDFFHDKSKRNNSLSVELRYIWSLINHIDYADQIFTSQSNFKGHHFTTALNPYSHHVQGYEISKEEGGTSVNMYKNYWGYEIDLLVEISRVLNFTYTIVNPADGLWGNIEDNGKWSGLVNEASSGAVDFVMSSVMIMYSRHQVLDSTIRYDLDFLTFAIPQPRPLPKYMALYQPFRIYVWLAIVMSLIISAFVFAFIAHAEEGILNIDISGWSTISKAGWYCSACMIGENVSSDYASEKTHALRFKTFADCVAINICLTQSNI